MRNTQFLLIRHGKTEMNEFLARTPWGSANFQDPCLWDSKLSHAGVTQTESVHNYLVGHEHSPSPLLSSDVRKDLRHKTQLVISSPLTRALHTANMLFKNDALITNPTRLVHPLAAERLYMSGEVGKLRKDLETEFPRWNYDLMHPEKEWWFTDENWDQSSQEEDWRPPGKYACAGEPIAHFSRRMQQFRDWLLTRDEETVVVVCHWGVIRALTGRNARNCEVVEAYSEDLANAPLTD